MKLSDLLRAGAVQPAMTATTVAGAMDELVGRLVERGLLPVRAHLPELDAGEASGRLQLHDLGEGFALVAARVPRSGNLIVSIGTRPTGAEASEFEGLVLLLTEHPLATLRVQVVPAIRRAFSVPATAHAVRDAERESEVVDLEAFQGVELHEYPLVRDAMVRMTYRVYPDTPIDEAVSLMSRRGLRALAVVGERHELLGILTSGDLLGHLLPAIRTSEADGELPLGKETVREAMSRAVMCVSEDQSLMEAAHIMVNKRIHQLPVTKEGQVAGFLTRDGILSALFGSDTDSGDNSENGDEDVTVGAS